MTIPYWLKLLLLSTTVAAAGCADAAAAGTVEEYRGPLMRPGWNCLSCHRESNDQDAPVWTAAGTIYPNATAAIDQGQMGVSVILTDANGHVVQLVTNEVGNFYTAEPLVHPIDVALEYEGRRRRMPSPPPAGSCNACHANPPLSGAPGRIFAP